MGTNYYWVKESNKCACCGRSDKEERHIGKSSAGWCFHLHVYPDEGINTLEDWIKKMEAGGFIRDEYEEVFPLSDMVRNITERSWPTKERSSKFYADNHAEPGPNNLLRFQFGRSCIGHGEGTWDYIIGDFS